jgi:hypothetical protein
LKIRAEKLEFSLCHCIFASWIAFAVIALQTGSWLWGEAVEAVGPFCMGGGRVTVDEKEVKKGELCITTPRSRFLVLR